MKAPGASCRLIFAIWLAVGWSVPPVVTWAGDLETSPFAIQDILGTYDGKLWSNGVLAHATTTFFLDSEDRLAGTYRYDENGATYAGSLFKPLLSVTGDVTFIWQDEFGFGTLTLRFSNDLRQFAGTWSTLEDGSEAYPWYGKRID